MFWDCFIRQIGFVLACGIFLAGVAIPAVADDGVELRIGTMHLLPYGWTDDLDQKHGVIYELHQEIGKRSGLTFSNEIIPFARMVSMLKAGELDLITCQPHAVALEAGDKLMVQNDIKVIAGVRSGSSARVLSDFKGKSLLYIIDASYPFLLDYPQSIHRVKNYEIMLKMLHERPNIDAGVFSEPAYYYWIKALGYAPSAFGKPILVSKTQDWVFVRKGLPEEIRENLKQVIEGMQSENYYGQLIEKMKQDAGF